MCNRLNFWVAIVFIWATKIGVAATPSPASVFKAEISVPGSDGAKRIYRKWMTETDINGQYISVDADGNKSAGELAKYSFAEQLALGKGSRSVLSLTNLRVVWNGKLYVEHYPSRAAKTLMACTLAGLEGNERDVEEETGIVECTCLPPHCNAESLKRLFRNENVLMIHPVSEVSP